MKAITTLLLSLALATCCAQQASHTISGYIKDAGSIPVAGATVRLFAQRDSAALSIVASADNGFFILSNIAYGHYRLDVSAIGQLKTPGIALTLDSVNNSIRLPAILLLPAKAAQLTEVVVKAKRPLLVQEIDKTVVNVDAMISSAGSNTLEVLEKTPGVTVTGNGEISLNGRSGILVLIDGRATYMSGQDLAAYLKSIPGSLIDKIELMDNPPARYDAAGNAIINIKLKKNRVGGFTGNISLGYSQGVYGKNNNAINLNYNYRKLNLFGNIGYSYDKGYNDDRYDRSFFNPSGDPVSTIVLLNRQYGAGQGYSSFIGADYTLSANTTVGALFSSSQNRRNDQLAYSTETWYGSNPSDSTGRGNTASTDKRNNAGVNLNLLHKFGKTGRELSAEANYLLYKNDGNQYIQNDIYLAGYMPVTNSKFRYMLPSSISIYTIKADYVHPFKKNIRLETGFKSSVVENDNTANYYTITGSTQTINNKLSNHFIYKENINAVYVNTQAKWNRFGAQLGLRAENTIASGHQLGNDSVKETRFTKNYTQLFPSIFFSYKLDTMGINTLTISLTRRINRPNYQLLNPFVFMRDQYSYTAGNPLLTPQYQYRYELRWQHKQFLRMSLSYNRFSDIIFQTTEVVSTSFFTRPNNVARGYMLLLNTGFNRQLANWWTINTDILLSKLGLRGMAYTEQLYFSTYVARINVLNQLQFGKGWSAEAGAYYASRNLTAQSVTKGMVRANAGMQKKILKDKASIRLSADDIFHSWVYHNQSFSLKQAQFLQTGESDTQRIGIAFTYRFGKSSFARKNKNNNDASDEEKGRVN
jgi:Outer membrane protein beta-barrel family/Carboxypeptidase regulatory-like domain/TonB-dependent Receptor Plug Domain